MVERVIGREEVVLDGGNSLWRGLDDDGGAPKRSPALDVNEVGEPAGVILWGGEGDYTGGGRRRRILLKIEDNHFRRTNVGPQCYPSDLKLLFLCNYLKQKSMISFKNSVLSYYFRSRQKKIKKATTSVIVL